MDLDFLVVEVVVDVEVEVDSLVDLDFLPPLVVVVDSFNSLARLNGTGFKLATSLTRNSKVLKHAAKHNAINSRYLPRWLNDIGLAFVMRLMRVMSAAGLLSNMGGVESVAGTKRNFSRNQVMNSFRFCKNSRGCLEKAPFMYEGTMDVQIAWSSSSCVQRLRCIAAAVKNTSWVEWRYWRNRRWNRVVPGALLRLVL